MKRLIHSLGCCSIQNRFKLQRVLDDTSLINLHRGDIALSAAPLGPALTLSGSVVMLHNGDRQEIKVIKARICGAVKVWMKAERNIFLEFEKAGGFTEA